MAVAPEQPALEVRKGFTVDGVGVVDTVLPCARALAVRVGPRRVRLIPFAEIVSVDPRERRLALRRRSTVFGSDESKGEER